MARRGFLLISSRVFILGSVFILGRGQSFFAQASKDFALFSEPQKVSHRDFVVLRNGQFRNMRLSYGRPQGDYKSPILLEQDNFKKLSKAYKNLKPFVTNIFQVVEQKLFSGKSQEHFWGYVNSPTYKGGIAMRPQLNAEAKTWPQFYRQFKEEPPEYLYQEGKQELMSAAEKYDFLLGTANQIFRNETSYSEKVFLKLGKIPHWAGICHGTAPASFLFPEPKKAVGLKGHDGSEIVFTPNDIKRLAAHLWAENFSSKAQVGRRCNLNELGSRQKDCLDTNPATFHLSLMNYIGINKKSFIIDNAYDSMVWNRPVMGFEYKFRNPVTKLPSNELKYSMVKVEELGTPPLKSTRSPEARYVVGVQMKVKLLYGNDERSGDQDELGYDIVYYYDLEISEAGEIVGGEWETLYHPDFIWTVMEGSLPRAPEDYVLLNKHWDTTEPLPEVVRAFGKRAANKGKLLYFIVERLVQLSSE